ncbi:hypothetical protein [uncultured Oscillibacter sp.]|uniref:hypothetical protein n=1 Tax=uncultured Oscillibacter sp. TaxID=876091 RepID=UPI002631BE92|nr:hypothetical protein [uncultured Oscillibacter sp.]
MFLLLDKHLDWKEIIPGNFELVPAVRTVLELSPANRKRTFFDKTMNVAHLLLDGSLAVTGGIVNSAIQTYALMREHQNKETGIRRDYIIENFGTKGKRWGQN